MQKILIVGRFQQPNKYTLAALVGILETSPILDAREISFKFIVRRETPSETLRKVNLAGYDKVIVLFPLLSTQLNYFKEEMNRLNQIKHQVSPPVIIIAGGAHPTFYPEEVLDQSVDFVVRGEAEEVLPRLVKAIAEGTADWRNIPGIACKDADRGIKNPIETISSIDP